MAVLAAAGVLLWLLVTVRVVATLIFIAVLLSVYLTAGADALARLFRMPRLAGLIITLLGTLVALAAIAIRLVPAVVDQLQSFVTVLPTYLGRVEQAFAEAAAGLPGFVPPAPSDRGITSALFDDAASFLRASVLPYMQQTGVLAIEFVSALVMALYLARNPELYQRGLVLLVPPRWRVVARNLLNDLGQTLRAWVLGQLFAMVVLGVLTAIGLLALRVPYWLAFGVFTGLLAIVPFFGTIVSTLLPALFVLGSSGWLHAAAVVALGIIVHIIEANIVIPIVMQQKISLPPVLTIASVLVMAKLLGPVGLLVAVPVLASVMVMVRHVLINVVYEDAPADAETFTPTVLVPTGEYRVSLTKMGKVSG